MSVSDLLQAALDSINSAKDTIATLEADANALRLRAETAEDVLRTLADKPDAAADVEALKAANDKFAEKLARIAAVVAE
jgi:uncharacterized phage infection (PIP) family protein YhgE